MNLRKWLYFNMVGLRGQRLGAHYERFLREDRNGIAPDTTKRLLTQLLAHCRESVPYYARVMRDLGDSYYEDPEEYLKHVPVLTKSTIRAHFDELKSADLSRRKWYFNWTGGSTGEPLRFIQDREYSAWSGAIALLYSKLVGRETGESAMYLWGSPRDMPGGTENWRARLVNGLTNTTFLSVSEMAPVHMRDKLHTLNTKRPKLIVAYAGAMYHLAKFAERNGLMITPQTAVITSGETLYPHMRDAIERVFQCKVFNRYGSREVGDIACERPGVEGLWVAPWGNYAEIVNSEGNRVPDGTRGEILVTSLSNYAMPFLRYRIEDCGVLSPRESNDGGRHGQVLEDVLGRTVERYRNRHGILIDSGKLMVLLYYRDWISKYQVIQKSHSHIVYRIVKAPPGPQPDELEEISEKTRLIMEDDVDVTFQLVDEIVASDSGKYRFIISEVVE
jgi:phenylacetate-CoA ligase